MSNNRTLRDGLYKLPTPDGPKRWMKPFMDKGDMNAYLYDQDFIQIAKLWKPAVDFPKEVTNLIGDSEKVPPFNNFVHRCVEEGTLEPFGDSLVRWTRTYARTPNSRFDWEDYNWLMPGVATSDEENLKAINKTSSSQGGSVTTIVTDAAHGASVGDFVSIRYNARIQAGEIQRAQLREVLTAPNSTTFTVAKILDDIMTDSGGILQWRTVQVGITRQPRLITVSSKTTVEYFGVGEKAINSPEDIKIIEKDTILTAEGAETDTYSPTTDPTTTEYRALTGKWIVAEDSTVRLWKGHIYERATRYVRAK